MLSFQQAKEIAEKIIETYHCPEDDKLVIIDSRIIEKPYAWIFPYTSKRWLEGDINYALGGNCPLFIDKRDGRISMFRTGLSIEGMIDEYEEQNKVWYLKISGSVYSDLQKLYALKNVLKLTQIELTELKINGAVIIDKGAQRRLNNLTDLLKRSGIESEIFSQDVI